MSAALGKIVKRGGKRALLESLQQVELTEQEWRQGWRHKEALAKKHANAKSIDIPQLWEELIGSIRSTCANESDWTGVRNLFETAQRKRQLGLPLSEAEVNSSAFQLLTQAKLFTTMQATYELTPAVFEELAEPVDIPYKQYDHVIPSDAPQLDYVPEGGVYPEKPLTDRYAQTKANKFGARVSLTREALITDRTGQVVQQAQAQAESAKYRQDELAALAWADSSNASLIPDASEQDAGAYYPERIQKALYRAAPVTSGTLQNYQTAVNLASANYLLQWDSVATALQLLMNMKNVQGQQIETVGGNVLKLVMPHALEQRARLLTALQTGIEHRANASAGTEFGIFHTPQWLQNIGVKGIQPVLWRKLPSAGTLSQSIWYLTAMPGRQFKQHRRWDVEFSTASQAQLGGEDFRRDVLMSVKGGFNAGFRHVDDKYVIKNG